GRLGPGAGRCPLAPGGGRVLAVVAAVRAHGCQPAGPVVAARAGPVRAAPGPHRRVLAAAAARRAGQVAGPAAVAALALAGARPAPRWRAGGGSAGRGAGHGRAAADARPQRAL